MNNGKICVSVCTETAAEFIDNIKRAEDLADIIELRFDCLNDSEIQKVWEAPASIKDELCTFRPKEQGGNRKLSVEERLSFWNNDKAKHGWTNFSTSGNETAWADIEIDLYEINATWNRRNMICSHHDFSSVPRNLNEIYERLKTTNANVLKLAFQTADATDAIPIWKLLDRAKSDNREIIPIAMGEAGKWTRILGLAHGAFMTYAALESGKETASGQISARDLIDVYRVKGLDTQTEVYGIIGNPVSHSLSPYIHNAAFKIQNRNAVFVPFEVKNLDDFVAKFLRAETREVELNFKGFAVTIPHKQAIIKHLDSVEETARSIGAVNTVKIVDGKLCGFNTDAQGFIEPLEIAFGDLKAARAGVLGNGGAARAAIYALQNAGAKAIVYARNIERAQILAADFSVEIRELDARRSTFDDIDILINATPLGTKGVLENETPVSAEQIKKIRLAYDLIYNPNETTFLREAKNAGAATLGGLAMLISQAAAQYKIWTNLDAPVEEMQRTALSKLQS